MTGINDIDKRPKEGNMVFGKRLKYYLKFIVIIE